MAFLKHSNGSEREHQQDVDYREISQDLSSDSDIKLRQNLLTRDTIQSIPSTPRKRRWIPCVAIFFYAVLMLFFWVATAVLCFKPTQAPKWYTSYNDIAPCHFDDSGIMTGFGCSGSLETPSIGQIEADNRLRRSARVIGSIMSVLAIPISSAVCARGAVAYLQNRREERFVLSKSLALADRGWWDPTIAGQLFLPGGRRKYGSRYLLIATCICALGAIIWPLQELLLTQDSVQLIVRPIDNGLLSAEEYIPDADITGLSQINSTDTIRITQGLITSAGYWDSQPNIWRLDDVCKDATRSTSWTTTCISDGNGIQYANLLGNSSFVSYTVNSIKTGLVENHSFRFNSTIECHSVGDTEYPRPCTGFSTSSVVREGSDDAKQVFEICAPGERSKFPWEVTRNRQDIQEDVYIHFNAAAASFLSNNSMSSGLTQRCTADTTAGYFLLPNHVNTTAGPLLAEFDLASSNDPEMAFPPYGTGLGESTPDDMILGKGYPIPPPSETPAHGPLLTATISLFGPSTFFSTRANTTSNSTSTSPSDTCTDTIPFAYLTTNDNTGSGVKRPNLSGGPTVPVTPLLSCASTEESAYSSDINTWLMDLFLDPEGFLTSSVFTQAVFFANKANLASAATVRPYRRTIVIDQGTEAQKLNMSLAAIIVVSVVMVLHIAGLIGLAGYTCRYPTWTETLNAFAVLRLGLRLGGERREMETFRAL